METNYITYNSLEQSNRKGKKICSSPIFFNHLSSSYRTQKQNFGILTKIAFLPPCRVGPLGLTAGSIISQLVAWGGQRHGDERRRSRRPQRVTTCVWSPPTTVLPCPPTHGKIATTNKPAFRSTTKEKCRSTAEAACLLLGANYKK